MINFKIHSVMIFFFKLQVAGFEVDDIYLLCILRGCNNKKS